MIVLLRNSLASRVRLLDGGDTFSITLSLSAGSSGSQYVKCKVEVPAKGRICAVDLFSLGSWIRAICAAIDAIMSELRLLIAAIDASLEGSPFVNSTASIAIGPVYENEVCAAACESRPPLMREACLTA